MSDIKVVKGRLISVENKEKHFSASTHYIAVQVEDSDGSNERCLLFTEKELEKAEYRASRNPEDLTKKGFITNLFD
jgi:hypothetical protein